MRFAIDFAAMVETLPVMLYGMLGGILVMFVIYAIIMLLYRFGKRSGKADGSE